MTTTTPQPQTISYMNPQYSFCSILTSFKYYFHILISIMSSLSTEASLIFYGHTKHEKKKKKLRHN
uniref:Putative ovule protein n=1 Tax=Solanum chacoense TaxID=4108 RepID=A0A0V0GX13_SOLCH